VIAIRKEAKITMPNIALAFKQEITRLARKESRTQTSPLRKATAKERKDVAQLKRQFIQLQRELNRIHRIQPTAISTPVTEAETGKGIRFRAKGVIAHRKRLGLSAADYGKLIGITGKTGL